VDVVTHLRDFYRMSEAASVRPRPPKAHTAETTLKCTVAAARP
jgi:hypothetical protein